MCFDHWGVCEQSNTQYFGNGGAHEFDKVMLALLLECFQPKQEMREGARPKVIGPLL